jgi:2-polyprenyl-6-methoxyphenol hydroxylase-like FAD-dependent oxidoreductase
MLMVQVLIVGAGPTGLVLACDLQRRGIDYRIVEKSPHLFAGSRGKGIQPRTQELLDDLGLIGEVRAAGSDYPALRVHTPAGDQEMRMDELKEPTPAVPYPNTWMLPQWLLGELLAKRLLALGGDVDLGAEVLELTQDADGVAVRIAYDGVVEEVRADYVVGADGGRSLIRRALGIDFIGETFEEQRLLIADVKLDGLSRDVWHVWPAESGRAMRLALCPLPSTDQFQLTAPLAEGGAAEASPTALQDLLDAVGSGARLVELGWTSLFRANIRMVERYRSGRVFLAGDAAHVHSPAGGQGLNTGMQDAYNLSWKLAAVLNGADEALLDTYEAERLPVAAEVLGVSSKLHNRAAAGDAQAHRRDDPSLKQLGIGYPDSSLSVEERATPGSVRAGDRAPDAGVFNLLRGPHWTLLVFGTSTVPFAALQSDLGVHVEAVTSPVAREAYGVQEGPALFLIRPDGYVGLATDVADPLRIASYLEPLV